MNKLRWVAAVVFFALLCAGILVCTAADAKAETEPDEWTVMFYFCGSDLESKYGYASENLNEIRQVFLPSTAKDSGVDSLESSAGRNPERVNILVETGGSREWHAQDAGMDISTDALQRWHYVYRSDYTDADNTSVRRFELMETLPLQSMGDPDTLADFIRWSAQTYPADKYALVLWDHGNGAKSGLCIDELFDGDVMYLYELRQALSDGGVHLETVIIDACLMANLETAWSLKDSASWMVASEEVVPGKGTAIREWLQALVSYPSLDGKWLGRCVCDMTGKKYANEPDDMAKSLLTWSVIDLSRIDRLLEASRTFFRMLGKALKTDPYLLRMYAYLILATEEYGDGVQNMRDLGSLVYNEQLAWYADEHVMEEMISALSDAVVYIARGPGRSAARGLSLCYPADFTPEELDEYAKNFPMPAYLAFLDAISVWSAPDWVYEQIDKLPEIDTLEALRITADRTFAENGLPGLSFQERDWLVFDVFYDLYQLNETTGEVSRLGRTKCSKDVRDNLSPVWKATDPMHWPAVDGTLCCIDLVKYDSQDLLYNIPVQLNSDTAILRCGRTISYSDDGKTRLSSYDVYGVWEGYDENSELMNRSVKPLAMLAGQKFRFLYPTDEVAEDGRTVYALSGEQTMYRAMHVEEIPLPPGTYYLEYEITDLFMRTYRLNRIELYWDGKTITFPDGFSWEGSFRVDFGEKR